MQEAAPKESTEAAPVSQPLQRRSSRQPRQRYLDNSLTGNEVFDLLDDFIAEDESATRPRKRRKKKPQPKAASAVAVATDGNSSASSSNVDGTGSQSKQTQKPSTPVRPRWYTQMYVMFLALRQSPGHTASRSDLVRRVVELDKRISEERGLPRAFTGKTPQNSASALLTNNCDRNFIQFRPEGARCFHFRLAYKPGDFEGALAAYNEWMDILINRDWPLCFGPDIDPNDEQKVSKDTILSSVEAQQQENILESAEVASKNRDDCLAENPLHDQTASVDKTTDQPPSVELHQPAECLQEAVDSLSIQPSTVSTVPNQDISTTAAIIYDIPKSWRDIVEVKPSTIPNAGSGLFATRDLPAGIPLGFYFGVPMTEDEFDSLKENLGMSSHYSIMYRKTVLDATDENGLPYTDPDGRLYCPFHFMNEDREGEKCNIVFLEGVKVNQIICLTKRKILSGEELFVSYGNEVDRSHWDKKECQQTESGGSETATDSHEITTAVDDNNNKTWGIRATQTVVPASTEVPSAAENNGIVRMLQTLTTAGTTHEDTNSLEKDL